MTPDPSGETWRDAALLLDIVLAAEDALGFVADLDERAFLASGLHQSAVIRKLEIIGEAAGKVSKAFRTAHPEIPWTQMTGMRHRLIHDYVMCGSISCGARPRTCCPASSPYCDR